MEITSEQIRAARALLRLEQAELAERARVSVVTIRRLERGRKGDRVAPGTSEGVRQALEEAWGRIHPRRGSPASYRTTRHAHPL